MKFTQIAHEKRFKFVLMGQFTLITACVVLLFVWTQIVEPGALFGRLHFLKGEVEPEVDLENQLVEQLLEPEGGNAYLVFILFGNGATALAMLTAEICACAMRPASLTIIHPGCSVGLVVNVIPFFTINLSIVMIIVVQTVAMVFFGFLAPFWLIISAVTTTILVTNKGARAHVELRLRQQIDRFTIGGNNTAHPVVSIALVPLRSLNRYAPTMPTSTRVGPAPTLPTSTTATLCPVEAFECQEEGGVDNYGCQVENIDLHFEDSDEDEDIKEEKDTVEIHNYGCKVEDIHLPFEDSEEDDDVKEQSEEPLENGKSTNTIKCHICSRLDL